MRRASLFLFFFLVLTIFPSLSNGKEVPKIAVWDLIPGDIKPAYAQDLTSILVSEVSKLRKYEIYSQENVRTLAGWTAERMQLGCTDTKCLTALGQMDISKLISGRVGKIGNTYSISLNLFDTQNARAEKAVSDFCQTEDELIPLLQKTVTKLLGEQISSPPPPAQAKIVPQPPSPPSPSKAQETGRDGRFIAYDNGTVIDTKTGLMWAAKDNGSNIKWPDAKRYCENYRGGGYTDWRMPTLDELAGLYDKSKSRPTACSWFYNIHVATELINITCFAPWASETRGPEVADFSFRSGDRNWGNPSLSGRCRALPVRSGK